MRASPRKLSDIGKNAVTSAQVKLEKLQTVEGAGSGLDAGTLDGQSSAGRCRAGEFQVTMRRSIAFGVHGGGRRDERELQHLWLRPALTIDAPEPRRGCHLVALA
jgi:hypothetical protein